MCCKIMAVKDDDGTEFKPYGSWCPKCDKPNGCTIYETKPKACGAFECLWLQSQASANPMPAELRPDKVHFVLTATEKSVVAHVDIHRPEAYHQGPGGRLLELLGRQLILVARIGDRRVAIGPHAIDVVQRHGVDL
jgi:hypothetical protein